MRFPRFQNSRHTYRVVRKPYDSVPVRCQKKCSAIRFENATRLRQNAINIGNILDNLCAYDNIKRRICLIKLGGITNFVRKPCWMFPSIAKSY